ncbi:MAG: LruC domain-containing protein [Bacteroides sp.]
MKTNYLLGLLVIITMLSITSCEKSLYDPNQKQDQKDKTISDLVIPEDFDWTMTQTVTCKVTSDHSARLFIYLNEACSTDKCIAAISVEAGTNASLPLSIAKSIQQVYVQYESTSGKTVVYAAPVDASGTIIIKAPADSKAATTRAGEEKAITQLFSHGTIMFEDNYPAIGDYDFNDFVAYYKMTVTTNFDNTEVNKMELEMTVAALGGINPYIPCLRLPYNSTIIKKATLTTTTSDVTLAKKTSLSDGRTYPVYFFNGAEQSNNKQGQFLNTEKGTTPASAKVFTLTVEFKEGWVLWQQGDPWTMFGDIFLADRDNNSKEIHMLGYKPAFGNDTSTSSNFYDLKNNTTYRYNGRAWGINIPGFSARHAYEKENFLKAYPDLAKWAESNGAQNKDWYETNINGDFLYPSLH